MNNDTYPGYTEAKELGYTLYCHSGDYSSATYIKGKLCLEIFNNKTANLSACYRIVIIKINNFSFPNRNFNLFEKQILTCLPTV